MEQLVMVVVLLLAGLGCLLLLLASVGLLRMPDVYMRMQVASKASTLGAALVLGGAVFGLDDGPAATRAVVTILFLCITTPVAAHLLARAAAHTGVPFSEETTPVDLPSSPFDAPEEGGETSAGPDAVGSPEGQSSANSG